MIYKKPEFYVEITETLTKKVMVKAYDDEEAEAIARKMYEEGDIVLTSDDYVDTEFRCLGDRREVEEYDD